MKNEQEMEKKIIEEAQRKADAIIKNAQECANEIYGASLLYVDDMLTEVGLAAKKARASVTIIMNQVLEDLDRSINIIEDNKNEILKDLNELSENGTRPIVKANYEIKIDDFYVPKQAYDVKITDGVNEETEHYKPAKQPFEIKVAEEWKSQVEEMNLEPLPVLDLSGIIEEEKEEEKEGYSSSDFDLDSEYFNWLEENK